MIEIKKQSPPPDLLTLQQSAIKNGLNDDDAYSTLKGALKKQVLHSLIDEQGGICAYCMRRIPDTRSVAPISSATIEHMVARHNTAGVNAGLGLDYNNFLAVCSGNRAKKGTRKQCDLTCDAARGNATLTIDPTQPQTLATIFYHSDGRMDATDQTIRDDIVNILNLNCVTANLVGERKAALDALQSQIVAISADSRLNACKRVLSKMQSVTSNKPEYVGILIWWLQDYISKHSE